MSQLVIQPGGALRGRARVPGDKSISHRALMLGALAEGDSHIAGFLPGGDCLATLDCIRALGVEIEVCSDGFSRSDANSCATAKAATAKAATAKAATAKAATMNVTIHGRGLYGLQVSVAPLDCVRSGTTMRLLAGILAGQTFDSVLAGDPQLLRRPMRRITEPLRRIGADITDTEGHGPLVIRGKKLRGSEHQLTVASAQVKSAILLAGLFAEGVMVVHECGPARDHTERMLKSQIRELRITNHESRTAQPPLATDGLTVTLDPTAIDYLETLNMTVPGDMSSAAFPLVAALLVADSEITLEGVGVNPTRTGLLDVLAAMGADIVLGNQHEQGGEPVADLTVRSASLMGTEIGGDTVVRMIDEFPILAVAATQAEGRTVVRDAAELRVKETDRVAVVVEELRKLGARIEPLPDGFVIEGPMPLRGAAVDSHGDHRLGMALAVAGLVAEDETIIENAGCIADSFPGFVGIIQELGGNISKA
ncbi:MAG: 3-phosphoshikimate 1-carboxyvinyltransferase [Anaerolineae bacterium]|nr:3-phosphoshikimate 1-carboxyvinyltransferase [Anaerolineae bacterium]